MKKIDKIVLSNLNDLMELISVIETLIMLTKEACFSKELHSVYYELDGERNLRISRERNLYINTLDVVIEKIDKVKNINDNLEQFFCELKQDSDNRS